MNTNRRNFLKTTGIIGLGLSLNPRTLSASDITTEGFFPRLGICTSINNSKILIEAGYDYLEEGVGGFLVPSEQEEIFLSRAEQAANSGITVEACNSFIPGHLKSVGPEIHHDAILQYVETAFRRAKVSGIKTIVFGSSGSRGIPEGFAREEATEQFITLCKQIAEIGSEHEVVVSLEPLNRKECNFINSLSEGAEIVRKVDHNNFRLLADIYHMLMENEGPESIIENGDLLYHVHIAEKEGRTAPGVHKEDFVPFFNALRKVGYSGRISIECRWENLELQSFEAIKTLKEQCSMAG